MLCRGNTFSLSASNLRGLYMQNLASQKIEELNQQIESLKKKKEQIQDRHLEQIAKVITKCNSVQWSLETIAGIMLEAQERLNSNPQLREVWHCAGEKFL